MKKINHFFLIKLVCSIVLIIVIISLCSYIRYYINIKSTDYLSNKSSFAKNVSEDNLLLKKFKSLFNEREVILACSDDINNDGLLDLVVISKLDGNFQTIALLDFGNDNFETTEPIPAPKENQYIKFFNMDKSGANEILIMGEYKGKVGYSIYRYENGKLLDIFGEGMEDCC